MSGKGRDDPRNPFPQGIPEPKVGYGEDDIAMTQKMSRPKLPRIEKVAPSVLDAPLTMLRPKQGGAVDASALLRARKVSSPNQVAIRSMPEPASVSEPTVARAASIPSEAYPFEGAPSTQPDPIAESTARGPVVEPIERFDDVTQRGPIYVPDDIDVESIRSIRDVEPRSLVTQQVPADVVKILRSRAALENELVTENGLPVLVPDSQAFPPSGRDTSEALVLTNMVPAEALAPAEPPPISPRSPSPLAETRMSPGGALPAVAAQGAPPAPKPAPQLHTLPLGIKPADFLAGLAKAEAHAAQQNMHAAGNHGAAVARAAQPSASPSGETNAVVAPQASGTELAGSFASSGAVPVAQPSSGVFPQGAAQPGPQRFPSGQMGAIVPPGQGPLTPGGSFAAQAVPSASVPGVPRGTYPPGLVQAHPGASMPGTYPPGSMQAPPQGTYPPGSMQVPPQGTYPPGSMQGPMPGAPQGTYPPGSMQGPMAGAPQGTYPPGSMQGPLAGAPQGTYPPGSMQGPLAGAPQGTYPPGSMQGPLAGPGSMPSPGFAQQTFPPGSNPSPSGPVAAPEPPRRKSTGVMIFLLFVVVLACAGAWLSIKGKHLPWKHGALRPPASSRLA